MSKKLSNHHAEEIYLNHEGSGEPWEIKPGRNMVVYGVP